MGFVQSSPYIYDGVNKQILGVISLHVAKIAGSLICLSLILKITCRKTFSSHVAKLTRCSMYMKFNFTATLASVLLNHVSWQRRCWHKQTPDLGKILLENVLPGMFLKNLYLKSYLQIKFFFMKIWLCNNFRLTTLMAWFKYNLETSKQDRLRQQVLSSWNYCLGCYQEFN